MKIILNEIFQSNSYVAEKTDKEVIILQNVLFDIKKFNCKQKLHYIISKEGTIFELINPDYSFDTELNNKKNIDKKSISIGLLNEGVLIKRKNRKYYYKNEEYKEPMFESEELYKKEKFFATYKECQLTSLFSLLQYLFDRYPKIDKFFSNSFEYNEKWFNVKGIIIKSNIQRDSLDLTPAFPLERFGRWILKSCREEMINFVKILTVEIMNFKDFKKLKRINP